MNKTDAEGEIYEEVLIRAVTYADKVCLENLKSWDTLKNVFPR